MLCVFLQLAFTCLGHKRQDLCSPCNEMHAYTDLAPVLVSYHLIVLLSSLHPVPYHLSAYVHVCIPRTHIQHFNLSVLNRLKLKLLQQEWYIKERKYFKGEEKIQKL